MKDNIAIQQEDDLQQSEVDQQFCSQQLSDIGHEIETNNASLLFNYAELDRKNAMIANLNDNLTTIVNDLNMKVNLKSINQSINIINQFNAVNFIRFFFKNTNRCLYCLKC